MFVIQYTLTLLTIVLIPLMLWLGKKRSMQKTTYVVFSILLTANLVAWILSDYFAAYLYLTIISLLSMFLVKRSENKQL